MASSVGVDLKKDVQCSLCNDTLIEPKILQCFHTFCKLCIKRHAKLVEGANVFKCPKCSTEISLPELSSVEDLKPSVLHSRILKVIDFFEREKLCSVSESHSTATQHCVDCNRSLCDQCFKHHSFLMANHEIISISLGDSESKENAIEFMLSRENNCLLHADKILDLYCKDCEKAICLVCWKLDHDGHSTVSLEKYLATKRSTLSQHVDQLKEQETRMQDRVIMMGETASKVRENCEKAKAEVQEQLQKMTSELQQNAQEILKQIEKQIEKAEQKKSKCECLLEQARGAIEYGNHLLKKGLVSELIDEAKVGDCGNWFENQIEGQDSRLVVFDPNKELIKQVSLGLGAIRITDQIDLNTPSSVEDDAHVVSQKPNDPNPTTTDTQDKTEFKMKGLNVERSQCCFTGIAVNKENTRISISDSSNDCVYVFRMDGNLMLRYDNQGSGHGGLSNPQGLAFLNQVHLVITDCGNHRLCIVNITSGALVKIIGKQGKAKVEFNDPCDVYVDSECNIIVSDSGNNRVQVLTKDGKYKYSFGANYNINADGTILHNGLFYVSDSYHNVIHVFEMKGKTTKRILKIGKKGSGDGQLNEPCGLAIDNDNHLVVCDGGNKRIQKFRLDGTFLAKFTCKKLMKEYCCDVEVLKDGRLLVTCNESGVFYIK